MPGEEATAFGGMSLPARLEAFVRGSRDPRAAWV